jgi:hypothetical protein
MKISVKIICTLLITSLLGCAACSSDDRENSNSLENIDPGNDPNFTIVANTTAGLASFNRKVVVFGIPIYAVAAVEDARLLHAANVMAQYLDNEEDGTIDNQTVLDHMLANNAFVVMWKNESDLDEVDPPGNAIGQDLGNDETIPEWHTNGHTGQFDATLEEIWHIISHAGHASAYPSVFGTSAGSSLSNAMDIARGGYFTSIPTPYPANAWYTYDDQTCDYDCMGIEYIYWGMTSILGAQENRLDEIEQEWDLNTNTLMQSTDTALYGLLTDAQYHFPTILPDGTYQH